MFLPHYGVSVAAGNSKTELKPSITITSYPARGRYHYDFHECTEERGWVAYDTVQDTWTFGVWVNESALQVLIFADGEETLITCRTRDQFLGELSIMAAIYGQPPIRELCTGSH